MTRAFGHGPLDFRSMSPTLRFLIVANAFGFLLSWIVGHQLYDLFGLVPIHFWRDRWVWQVLTYLFIHGNILHVLINLLCLWMFAVPLEAQWGSREFVKYYFLCGIGAGLLSAAVHPASGVPVIGASGAIYGLLVGFAMLYPDAVVYLYFFFPIRARDMAILVGILEFFAGSSSAAPGVARLTHLSGMVIGYLYIRWWWIAQIKLKGIWYETVGRSGPVLRRGRPTWRSIRKAVSEETGERNPSMDEVDRILDKISAHGKESLSPSELEILRKISEERQGGILGGGASKRSELDPGEEGHA